MQMLQPNLSEVIGAALGSLGALLLAAKGRWSGFGFIAFLASNVAWLAFSRDAGHWFFFAQQVVFTLTSLIGIWRWLIQPRLEAALDLLTDFKK